MKKWITRDSVLLALVITISFFTYFNHYDEPRSLFWDENGHIAAAQKYLNRIYFMELHPPLARMLLALGEKILHPNPVQNQFIDLDYTREVPSGFSFAGFRLFPALLSWLTAPVIFFIFYLISRKGLYSFTLSGLYMFDNALIVHCRGAMLEGPFIFFLALCCLIFVRVYRTDPEDRFFPTLVVVLGAACGLSAAAKAIGLITLLFAPFLLCKLWPRRSRIISFAWRFAAGFIVPYLLVWQIHFALGKNINPRLQNSGFYQASPSYRNILMQGHTSWPIYLPVMLRDAWAYVDYWNRGVPRLNLCKPDENGSPFFYWPLGGRAINYKWETPDGRNFRYLFLQCNPVGWLCGLAGVLVSIVLLGAPVFSKRASWPPNRFLMAAFLTMYVSYMIVMSRVDRVMYLYHYFTPLFFSFILFGLVVMDIDQIGVLRLTEFRKSVGLCGLMTCVFAAYLFYSPLTYYRSLTDLEFRQRSLLEVWNLHAVHDPNTDPNASPLPLVQVPYYVPTVSTTVPRPASKTK
jgi:dolichyl-phosphate-mannose-protein mannosyltransferase